MAIRDKIGKNNIAQTVYGFPRLREATNEQRIEKKFLLYEIINTFKSRTDTDAALLQEILKELFHILIFIKLDSRDYMNAYEIR